MTELTAARAEARTRLAAAVEKSRSAGAPATELAATFREMSVDEVVAEVEERLTRAFERQESAQGVLRALDGAARALDAVGLAEDGDRLLLVAAAALEGREIGPTMRDLDAVATMAASAVAEEIDAARRGAEPIGDVLSAVLDTDSAPFVESMASGKRSEVAKQGASLRERLMSEGRAVAVGKCKRCRDAVVLGMDMRCPACGRRPKPVDFVVPSAVDAARAFLRRL